MVGQFLHPVVEPPELAAELAQLVACDGPPCQQVFYPAWSPDGTELAYARFDHPAGTEYEEDRLSLEVIDLASGVRRVVARAQAVAKARPTGATHRS